MAALDPAGRPHYTRMALESTLSWVVLGVSGVAVWLEHAWWPGIVIVGGLIEGLWLSLGARLPPARRHFDGVHARAMRQLEVRRQQALLRTVTEEDRRRFLELERLRAEVEHESASNPSLAMDLVRMEIGKIDALLTAFLGLAAAAARYEVHIEQSDLNLLEADARRQEAVLAKAPDAGARDLARKNLDVLRRRLEKAGEVRRLVRQSRAQLNLFENTFRLLRDQIVTMQSPEELTGQLAELTAAVDSIAATGREAEAIARRLDPETASLEN